jgi:hypothetical protein
MRIVADEKEDHQRLPPGTNLPRPCCSERAQTARLSITNNTRHPAHTAAHPALHTLVVQGQIPVSYASV